MFLLYIDVSGILNSDTFQVMPSTINDNCKNMLFHYSTVGMVPIAAFRVQHWKGKQNKIL